MLFGRYVRSVEYCFEGILDIKTIPKDLFKHCPSLRYFNSCFKDCESLEEIPAELFSYNPDGAVFETTFFNCQSLKEIPKGLFDNNNKSGYATFYSCFSRCLSLTTVPFNLFDKFTQQKIEISSCFSYCSNVTSALPDVWNSEKFPEILDGMYYALDCTKASNYDEIPVDFK